MTIIRRGSRGELVRAVQGALGNHGHPVSTDARFGRDTEAAVREFQRTHHLRADGVVGPRTAAALGLDRDRFEASPPRSSSSGADGFDGPGATPAEPTPADFAVEHLPPDAIEERTARLTRLATGLERLRAEGRPMTPDLERTLREVARTNPPLPSGTPLHFMSPLMHYDQARLHFVEAARNAGARVE